MRLDQSWQPVFVAPDAGERLLAGFVRAAPVARLLRLGGGVDVLWHAADVRRRPLYNYDGKPRVFGSRVDAEEAVACLT